MVSNWRMIRVTLAARARHYLPQRDGHFVSDTHIHCNHNRLSFSAAMKVYRQT